VGWFAKKKDTSESAPHEGEFSWKKNLLNQMVLESCGSGRGKVRSTKTEKMRLKLEPYTNNKPKKKTKGGGGGGGGGGSGGRQATYPDIFELILGKTLSPKKVNSIQKPDGGSRNRRCAQEFIRGGGGKKYAPAGSNRSRGIKNAFRGR